MRLHSIIMLLFGALASSAAASMVPASVPVEDRADGLAEGTARIVGAILEYTRWNGRAAPQPDPVRLCVIGPAAHAGRLDGITLSGGRRVQRIDRPAAAPLPADACDAIYLGQIGLPAMRTIMSQARGKPIVTIAEADADCRAEPMFCLIRQTRALSFRLNVDAVSRSAVTVDPRVLRMSRGY